MSAFIFVPLLAATIIFSFFYWCYVSHTLIVVVEDTAAGNDEIGHSDEPYHDWFWQAAYIAWIVGVWLVPAIFIGRWATRSVNDQWRPLAFTLIAFAVFWVTFPISLLSSMSAESRWAIFHGGLFVRVLKSIPHLLAFYVLSALLVAVCIPLVPWMLNSDNWFSLIVAPLLIGYAFVLYARLMGRLACIVRLTGIRRRKRPKKASAQGAVVTGSWDIPEQTNEEQEAVRQGFVQPEDLPALRTPHEGDVVGYNVQFGDIPKPARSMPMSELETPLGVEATDKAPIQIEREEARRRVVEIKPDQVEMERAKTRRPKMPKHPWTRGIWLFPLSSTSAVHWSIASAGLLFLGLLIRVLRMTYPFQ